MIVGGINTGPILDGEGMGVFLGHIFSEKRAFCLLAPPKKMPFLTISNITKIFFSKLRALDWVR